MNPFLSVIIPTLNEESCLPRLLDDLEKQTETNFEVIIVDGKSNDCTKEKALMYNNVLKLRFIDAPKIHLASQRNYGAEKAEGQYLFFLDADTRLDSNVIERLLVYIQKEGRELYLPYIKPTNPILINIVLFSFTIYSIRLLHMIGKPLAFGPLILINKKLFDKIGGYNLYTTASEDHNLVIKAYKMGVKARILKDVSVYYSTRRFDSKGVLPVLWQYFLFTVETLVRDGVFRKSFNYEMGGQNYRKSSLPK